MIDSKLKFEVNKYGQRIEETDIEISNTALITTRVYLYNNTYYMETYNNGYCVYFGQVINTNK